MSWGNKLLLVFVGFAALIGTLVYKAVNTKFDLVSDDYYKDELKYQQTIDGINNANKLSAVAVTETASHVVIQLPIELKGVKVEGEAWFYCKTNAALDKKIALNLNADAQQLVEKSQLAKAIYTLKLSWKAGAEQYYSEQQVIVN